MNDQPRYKGPFEADLDPDTMRPRIRMNFANGWTISIVLSGTANSRSTVFMTSSVAVWPTGLHNTGKTEILAMDAFSDEVADLMAKVKARPHAVRGTVQ